MEEEVENSQKIEENEAKDLTNEYENLIKRRSVEDKIHSENIVKILNEGEEENLNREMNMRIGLDNTKIIIKAHLKINKNELNDISISSRRIKSNLNKPSSSQNHIAAMPINETNNFTTKEKIERLSRKALRQPKKIKSFADENEINLIDSIYDNFQDFKNYKTKNDYINLTNLHEAQMCINNPFTAVQTDQNRKKFVNEKLNKIVNRNLNNNNIYISNIYKNDKIDYPYTDINNKLYVIESLQSDSNISLNNSYLNKNNEQNFFSPKKLDENTKNNEDEKKQIKLDAFSFTGKAKKIYINTIKNILDSFGILKDEENRERSDKILFKNSEYGKKEKAVKPNNNLFLCV